MAARLPSIHVKLTRKAMRRPVAGGLIVKFLKQWLSLFLSCCIVLATAPAGFADQADQSTSQPPVQAAQHTPAQLQQLVAPISSSPDDLFAHSLPASTYPNQIL